MPSHSGATHNFQIFPTLAQVSSVQHTSFKDFAPRMSSARPLLLARHPTAGDRMRPYPSYSAPWPITDGLAMSLLVSVKSDAPGSCAKHWCRYTRKPLRECRGKVSHEEFRSEVASMVPNSRSCKFLGFTSVMVKTTSSIYERTGFVYMFLEVAVLVFIVEADCRWLTFVACPAGISAGS